MLWGGLATTVAPGFSSSCYWDTHFMSVITFHELGSDTKCTNTFKETLKIQTFSPSPKRFFFKKTNEQTGEEAEQQAVSYIVCRNGTAILNGTMEQPL